MLIIIYVGGHQMTIRHFYIGRIFLINAGGIRIKKKQICDLHVAHRTNKLEELLNVPKFCGVEIDLRDSNNKIIVTHDPYTNGVEFEEYIKNYSHSFIILNIKSEGIEYKIKEILNKYNITNYFFLDSSFPMIYKLANSGESNIAIRLSEFEDINTVLNLKNLVKWVWVDCFTKFVIDNEKYELLKNAGFKLCLVSPELHNLNRISEIEQYKKYIIDNDMHFDMICTKLRNIKRW